MPRAKSKAKTQTRRTRVSKTGVTSSAKKLESKVAAKVKETPPPQKSKLTKYVLLTLVLVAIGVLLYFYKSLFVAALVNGKPVSRVALVKSLEKAQGKQALDRLITQELIMQQARKENITVSNEDVQKEIENISKDLESKGGTLDATLAAEGMSKSDLENSIKMKKTLEVLLSSEISVSDDEVKKYFDENKEIYGKDAKYEDLKETLRKDLAEGKLSSEFQKWYQKLQSESDIKYFVTF